MARGSEKSIAVPTSRQVFEVRSERGGGLASELARRLKASEETLQPKSGVTRM